MSANERKDFFEKRYQSVTEPWNYSRSGAEKIRYQSVIALAGRFVAAPRRVLDVGCSLGQLTVHLAGYAKEVIGLDISPTAIEKCRQRFGESLPHVSFEAGVLSEFELSPKSLDVIFYCDGIAEHQLKAEVLDATMLKIKELLTDDGVAVFTDFLGHRSFGEYRRLIRDYGFEVLHDEPLNDRLWFQVHSMLKAVANWWFVRGFLASEVVARFLSKVSSLQGEKGSKHLCLIVRK